MATSLTKTAQNQRKLQHLHAASRLLFTNSPAVSAHLATRLRSIASATGTPLPESAFRSQCACCGYLLVPGWTAKVRLRGYRVDGDREVGAAVYDASTERRESRGDSAPTSRNKDDKADTLTKKRKLKQKRRKRDSKQPQDEKDRIAKPKPTPTAVYTCLLCDRKTTQGLPSSTSTTTPKVSATAVAHTIPTVTAKPTSTLLQTSTSSSSLPLSSSAHKSAITTTTTTTTASTAINTITKPESVKAVVATSPTSVSNSSSKKRAKARKKSTLSDMLSKEKKRSESSGGGFGLDLMDLMKTS